MSYVGNTPFTAAFLTDTFSGNGSTVAFTMSVAPATTSSVIVAITGVLQDPSTYSVSGTTLTFSAAPPTGTSNISVRYLGIPASGVTTTAYRTQTEFTATAGQTTFSVPSYTVGFIDVYRNGLLLGSPDFTATNGTTVVLTNAASAGDFVETVSFYVSSVLNALPNTGGTLSGQLTINSPTGQNPLVAQVNGTQVFQVDASGTVGTGGAVNATGGLMTVVNPTGGNYNENLRLPRASLGGNYVAIAMATDPAASTGAINGQFTILVYPALIGNGQFAIRHESTDALTIQKSGYVGTPMNPAFEAKGNSSAVYSTTGWQKVLYSQSVSQRGTAYASSRFTAPVAGWYQFNAQWSAENNADTDGTFVFALNGNVNANKGAVSMPNTGPGYDAHVLSATMLLSLNDYVEVYRYSTVSTTSRADDWQGWFSGHFIG